MNIPLTLIREKVFINKTYSVLLILLLLVNLALLVERFWIIKTPQIVYDYVQFKKPSEYQVNRLKTSYLDNENLIKALIYEYVLTKERYPLKKEELNKINAMSNQDTFAFFQDFRSRLKDRIQNRPFQRFVQINMYQKISDDVRQIQLKTIDLLQKKKSIKKFKINIRFDFQDEIIKGDQLNINPSGFKVTNYAIAHLQQ